MDIKNVAYVKGLFVRVYIYIYIYLKPKETLHFELLNISLLFLI